MSKRNKAVRQTPRPAAVDQFDNEPLYLPPHMALDKLDDAQIDMVAMRHFGRRLEGTKAERLEALKSLAGNNRPSY